jgi:hypothetical protein
LAFVKAGSYFSNEGGNVIITSSLPEEELKR